MSLPLQGVRVLEFVHMPMPDRLRAWAVYDTFTTGDGYTEEAIERLIGDGVAHAARERVA